MEAIVVKTDSGVRHFLKELPQGAIMIKRLLRKVVCDNNVWFYPETRQIIKPTCGKYKYEYPYTIIYNDVVTVRYKWLKESRAEETTACVNDIVSRMKI